MKSSAFGLLIASAALTHVPAAIATSAKDLPVVVERDGHFFIGSQEVEMKDGVPWVDGKALQSYTVRRTTEQIARDRVPLPGSPGVDRLMLHVPTARLGTDLVLPRLFVFDARTGQPVSPDQLPQGLAAVFAKPQAAASLVPRKGGPRSLPGALKYAVDASGHAPSADTYAGARYVVVQWWAGWCEPCLEEGKWISEAYAATPMPDVKWIAVEKDPTRSEKSYRASATEKEAAL